MIDILAILAHKAVPSLPVVKKLSVQLWILFLQVLMAELISKRDSGWWLRCPKELTHDLVLKLLWALATNLLHELICDLFLFK